MVYLVEISFQDGLLKIALLAVPALQSPWAESSISTVFLVGDPGFSRASNEPHSTDPRTLPEFTKVYERIVEQLYRLNRVLTFTRLDK